MLLELEIKDFALVEHVRVPFTWGLNVLTGETGAGKSIIMDALNAVLGGKVGASVIRPQSERATIEATFKSNSEISAWLKHHELSEEDNDCFTCSREISRNGSKVRVNGTLVTSALIQDLRQKLVTVHAQHESRTLLSSQSQMEMLDTLGDTEHKKLLARIKTLHTQRKQLESELSENLNSEAERERRLDFARFQLAELEEARLEDADEDEALRQERSVLANISDLELMLAAAHNFLRGQDQEGSPGALDLLQKAAGELSRAAQIDESLSGMSAALSESLDKLNDETRAIRKHCDSLEADPERLSQLEERTATLAAIKRKYGPELSDAIKRQTELELEVERLSNAQTTINNLKSELEDIYSRLLESARQLSSKRKKLAEFLSGKIQSELSELGMTNCRVDIAISNADDGTHGEAQLADTVGAQGFDRAEFLICTNPGQPLLPVAKIASGGELSRVMLAIKTIFAGAENVPTVIFDEIDTGLSGRVLQTMRDKLGRLARLQQILCITHQPIIASIADNHVNVIKDQDRTSTRTRVSVLDEPGRLKALAGMASGEENQEAALRFATSLFEESNRLKKGF